MLSKDFLIPLCFQVPRIYKLVVDLGMVSQQEFFFFFLTYEGIYLRACNVTSM